MPSPERSVIHLATGTMMMMNCNASFFVAVNEMTPVKYRYKALFVNMIASASSYMLISCLNYLLQNWRYFLALYAGIQAIISVFVFW